MSRMRIPIHTIAQWGLCLVWLLCALPSLAQDCISGSIRTQEAYLYGRFEVRMQSAEGDGVVSSFFLYNSDVGCNWPAENNEIDIEMTGNNETVQFTTHYPPLPGTDYTFSYTEDESYGFNPHAAMHDYAFEWAPGIVRWFIDGELVYFQNQSFVEDLIHPMRIHMNLWAADAPSWVGNWDPSILPLQSEYDYVRCYAYTPGTGDTGTDNDFSLLWEDDFDSLDEERWDVSEFGGFGGNFCSFESQAVDVADGTLSLHITEYEVNTNLIPVHFSVNTADQELEPTDVIYLNGGFNNWCGTCEPMNPNGDIWSKTLYLSPGHYEYLFTKNFWEENGGAPQGSSCDFNPCDEWTNYGFTLGHDTDELTLETYCWSTCESCIGATDLDEFDAQRSSIIIGRSDLLGRPVDAQYRGAMILHYASGINRLIYSQGQ